MHTHPEALMNPKSVFSISKLKAEDTVFCINGLNETQFPRTSMLYNFVSTFQIFSLNILGENGLASLGSFWSYSLQGHRASVSETAVTRRLTTSKVSVTRF